MANSLVQIREIELLSPVVDRFSSEFKWRMKLDALTTLPDPVEIRFVWVGSAQSSQFDQLLDEIEVGPLAVGENDFSIDVDAPNPALIPSEELINVTVLQIVFQYQGAPFLTVAYYVSVAYFESSTGVQTPDLLGRSVLISKPGVTTHEIQWGVSDELEEE